MGKEGKKKKGVNRRTSEQTVVGHIDIAGMGF